MANPTARLWFQLRQQLWGSGLYRVFLKTGSGALPLRFLDDPWPGDGAQGRRILNHRFSFKGLTVDVAPDQLPWHRSGVGELWREEMLGFSWCRDMVAVEDDESRRALRRLIMAFILDAPTFQPLSWRPDLVGRRLHSWLTCGEYPLFGGDEAFRKTFAQALARHNRHLYFAASEAPTGPGRIAAAMGLIAAGICLPQQQSSLNRGLVLLEAEIANQILVDGGHVSRCPSIQLRVLADLTTVRANLKQGDVVIPDYLTQAIDRMTPMLRFFRHGDGNLALFQSGFEEDNSLLSMVLAKADAKGKPLAFARHSGYQRMNNGKTVVILDVATPPEPETGGVAHASTLAFEMSVAKHRLITNCGHAVVGGPNWIEAVRATAAHSTLVLNHQNSSELLANGGLGKRRAGVPRCTRHEEDAGLWLEAVHDGYAELFGLIHRRRLFLDVSGGDLRGEDSIEPVPDPKYRSRQGPGPMEKAQQMPVVIRFHLHPNVQSSMVENGQAVLLRLPTGAGWRMRARGGRLALEESVYLGKRGERRRCEQITLSGEIQGDPYILKWALNRMDVLRS